MQQVHCPTTLQNCTCQLDPLPAVCKARLGDLYRCILRAGATAFGCDASGDLAPRCGVCETEIATAMRACGGNIPACVQ